MKIIPREEYNIRTFPKADRYEPFFSDSTARKALMECRRKYFYRMVLGRAPKYNNNQLVLDFGSAYHKFREILELKGIGEARRYYLSATLPIVEDKNKWAYLTHLRLIKTCEEAYTYWENEKKSKRIEVIAVEQPFNVQIAEGIFISGRADQIVKWNGKVWGRDFKTTSKDKVRFDKDLDPNDQSIGYIVGESLVTGQPVQGIIFEAIQNTKTTGPKMFSTLSSRVKYQLDVWDREQKLNHRLLKIYREEDTWPMDVFKTNCSWCEYANVCRKSSEESMHAELISNYDLKPWDHNNVEQTIIEDNL